MSIIFYYYTHQFESTPSSNLTNVLLEAIYVNELFINNNQI